MNFIEAISISFGFTIIFSLAFYDNGNLSFCMDFLKYLVAAVADSLLITFIYINILIPEFIVLGILAYRSKPSQESFCESFDNMLNIISKYDQNKKLGMFQNLRHVMTMRSFKSKLDIAYYDAGIMRLAWVLFPEPKEKLIFIGIFGTWFPIK